MAHMLRPRSVVIGNLSYAWVEHVRRRMYHMDWPDDPHAWLHEAPLLAKSLPGEPRPRVFFVHWSERVPDAVVDEFECVNFHCTPLPYGRGGAPIENMILRGHDTTIMTAHRMVHELDAGPIYLQVGPISLAGTKGDILSRFVEPVSSMMMHIDSYGPEFPVRKQEGEVVRFHRLPTKEFMALWDGRQ